MHIFLDKITESDIIIATKWLQNLKSGDLRKLQAERAQKLLEEDAGNIIIMIIVVKFYKYCGSLFFLFCLCNVHTKNE